MHAYTRVDGRAAAVCTAYATWSVLPIASHMRPPTSNCGDPRSDCKNYMCGEIQFDDSTDCSGKNCVCFSTESPTEAPTPLPTILPTPSPTFSPPIVVDVTVGSGSDSNSTDESQEIDPTSKLTLQAFWLSNDPVSSRVARASVRLPPARASNVPLRPAHDRRHPPSLPQHTSYLWTCKEIHKSHTLMRGDGDDDDAADDVNLEYGVTTSTLTTTELLVVKPFVLEGGRSYQFITSLSNSYGKISTGTINVTAGRPPWGGAFDAAPLNGTSLVDTFFFKADNWTDDEASLPLTYAFNYYLESGASSYLSEGYRTPQNVSASLPLGYGDRYELVVGVLIQDIIGCTAKANTTVRSIPPSLDDAKVSSTPT